MLRDSAVEDGASRYEKHDTCEISIEVTGSLLLDGENDVSDVTYYTAGVPLLVLLMPRALDQLSYSSFTHPPTLLTTTLPNLPLSVGMDPDS